MLHKLISNVLFYTGCAVAKTFELTGHGYPLYSYLMAKSVDFDKNGDVWKDGDPVRIHRDAEK